MAHDEHGPAGDPSAHSASGDGSEPQPTSGMAVTAMILGLVSVPLACVGVGIVTGIVALILGIIALGQTGDPPFKMKGKGMAVTGLVLGIACVVIAPLAALMIGILLPALGAARRTARQIQNSTQLRSIHQEMVIYAQSNKVGRNAGYYPGLNPDGTHGQITVEERFKLLLDANAFSPDYIINPSEMQHKTPWQSGPLTAANYSYAMLQVPTQGGRHDEWAETLNTLAVVLTDRNTGTSQQPESVWSSPGGPWKGTVTRNDNSTGFESSQIIPQTQYGSHPANQNDELFNATGHHDALLIHEGER